MATARLHESIKQKVRQLLVWTKYLTQKWFLVDHPLDSCYVILRHFVSLARRPDIGLGLRYKPAPACPVLCNYLPIICMQSTEVFLHFVPPSVFWPINQSSTTWTSFHRTMSSSFRNVLANGHIWTWFFQKYWHQTRCPPALASFGSSNYHLPSALVSKSYWRVSFIRSFLCELCDLVWQIY